MNSGSVSDQRWGSKCEEVGIKVRGEVQTFITSLLGRSDSGMSNASTLQANIGYAAERGLNTLILDSSYLVFFFLFLFSFLLSFYNK